MAEMDNGYGSEHMETPAPREAGRWTAEAVERALARAERADALASAAGEAAKLLDRGDAYGLDATNAMTMLQDAVRAYRGGRA